MRLSVNFKEFIEKFLQKSLMLYLRFNDERKRQIKEMEESKLLILNEYEYNNKIVEKKSLEEIPEHEEEDVNEENEDKSSSRNSDNEKESVKKEVFRNNDVNGSNNQNDNSQIVRESNGNGINLINSDFNDNTKNNHSIFQFNKFYNDSDKLKKKNSLYDNNSSNCDDSVKDSSIRMNKLNGDGTIVYSKNINSIFESNTNNKLDKKNNSSLDESRDINKNKKINKISITKLENNSLSNNSSDEPSFSAFSNRNVANKSNKLNKNQTDISNQNDSKFLIANPQFDQIFANNNELDDNNKINSGSIVYDETNKDKKNKKDSNESENKYFDSSDSDENIEDINETFLNKVDEMINFFKQSKVKFEEKLDKNPIKMLQELKDCKDINERNKIIDEVAVIIQELTSKKDKLKNKQETKTIKDNKNDEDSK